MKTLVLVLIKPDGTRKNLTGHILNKLAQVDLDLIGLKIVTVSTKLAQAHYALLKDKPFFKDIVAYLRGEFHQQSPIIAMVFRGNEAVVKCRKIAGATNPEEADPKSIRGAFGRITTKGLWENAVHVSSDDKEAAREIKLWFKKSELLK